MSKFSQPIETSSVINRLPSHLRLTRSEIKQILEDHSKRKPKYLFCTRKQAVAYGFNFYHSEAPCTTCGETLRHADTSDCRACKMKKSKNKPSPSSFIRVDNSVEVMERVAKLSKTKNPNAYFDYGDHVVMYIESKVYGTVQVLVDRDDYYGKVRFYKWCVIPKGNGRLVVSCCNNNITVKLHQLVMTNKFIDHRNGDTLDNRKYNLFKSDYSQNMLNAHFIGGRVGYKGVQRRLDAKNNKFKSNIRVKGHTYYLGSYTTPIAAALAYDHAAKVLRVESSSLNKDIAPTYKDDISQLPVSEISEIHKNVERKITRKQQSIG